jgi:hypothetical protein
MLSIVRQRHTLLCRQGDGYLKKGNKLHVFPKGFRYIMGDNNDRTQISVRSSDVALYSRPARQQNLFYTTPTSRHCHRYMKDGRSASHGKPS